MSETGWWNPRPFDSRSKFHYVGKDGTSLCGRWARFSGSGTVDEGMDDHKDNCAACRKKKAKLSPTLPASGEEGT